MHMITVTKDTSTQLPPSLILAINHRGVHLISPKTHKHLGTLQYRDIGEYGGNAEVLTMTARVGGSMHEFVFATTSAVEITEAIDICIAGMLMCVCVCMFVFVCVCVREREGGWVVGVGVGVLGRIPP